MYLNGSGGDRIIIAVLVDDFLQFSGTEKRFSRFQRRFDEKFKVEGKGECKKVFGVLPSCAARRRHVIAV